ncbi:MAG: M20/M25/M40 family metallo-hydrolase [Gaiellaceae bacterium]|jgi:metal-dependent amidase/aminoacylase/carboxypeptidase family protein
MTDPQAVLDAVAAQTGAISAVSRFVHDHPELGHEEHKCSRYLCDTLAAAGLEVDRGVAGMDTAFRATLRGSRPGRTTGFVCLYDAVAAVRPDGRTEAVHSCGHGPIAGAVTGAALALFQLRDGLAGSVAVMGCPADEIHAPGTIERGGGKAISAAAGLWDGVDAALYAHPEFIDTVSLESRWMRRAIATVAGTRSLGTADQPPLRAALAALEATRSLVPDDVMLERLQFEGDVEGDTGLVFKATFLLFGDEEQAVDRGLATVQEALPEASWNLGGLVEAVRPDDRVTAAVASAFRTLGRDFVESPPRLPFATDFGNISQRCPAALIGVRRPGGWAFHTDEGAAQFASQDGEDAALTIAQVLALAAVELCEPAA